MFNSYTQKILIAIIPFSTYPIKLQLFLFILPTAISALKGLGTIKKEIKEKKRKRTKVPKERKSSQVLIFRLGRYVIPKEQM